SETERIKIAIEESILALSELDDGHDLIRFDRRDGLVEHRTRLLFCAALLCGRSARERENRHCRQWYAHGLLLAWLNLRLAAPFCAHRRISTTSNTLLTYRPPRRSEVRNGSGGGGSWPYLLSSRGTPCHSTRTLDQGRWLRRPGK